MMQYDVSDKKTRMLAWIGVVLIPLICFAYCHFHDKEIETHSRKIKTIIADRNIDHKGNVTVCAEFYTAGNKYKACDVVTGYEITNNFTINVGDSVIVEYSYRSPDINQLIFIPRCYKSNR